MHSRPLGKLIPFPGTKGAPVCEIEEWEDPYPPAEEVSDHLKDRARRQLARNTGRHFQWDRPIYRQLDEYLSGDWDGRGMDPALRPHFDEALDAWQSILRLTPSYLLHELICQSQMEEDCGWPDGPKVTCLDEYRRAREQRTGHPAPRDHQVDEVLF